MRAERKLKASGRLVVDATGEHLELVLHLEPLYLDQEETEWLIAMLQRANAIIRNRVVGKVEPR